MDLILYSAVLHLQAVAVGEVIVPGSGQGLMEVLAEERVEAQRLLVLEALETRRPLAQAKEVMVVVE